MSTFQVPICQITKLTPIEGADRIELAHVLGYQSVVQKDTFDVGEFVAYIPEDAIVPPHLLQEMGLWDAEKNKGKLSGKDGCRVRPIRLKGTLSQGLIYSGCVLVNDEIHLFITPNPELAAAEDIVKISKQVHLGDNVAEFMGITKYELSLDELPDRLRGDCVYLYNAVPTYDIENRKRYPDVLHHGEPVVVTEKIHGTYCLISVDPKAVAPTFFYGVAYASSKGLGRKHLVFKSAPGMNETNAYVNKLREMADALFKAWRTSRDDFQFQPIHIAGELFGGSLQDLNYGLQNKHEFRAFDVYVGTRDNGRWLSQTEIEVYLTTWGIPSVPILYTGPYDPEVVLPLANGTTIAGNHAHLREGIVIKPRHERRAHELGRVILKEISEAYLFRKDGTEYQ